MNELHWTGAAVLLAVAVLGGRPRPRRDVVVDWPTFAHENGLSVDEPAAPPSDAPAPRRARAATSRSTARRAASPAAPTAAATRRLRATATCGHCAREAGELQWDAAAPARPAVFHPATGGPARLVYLGARLRCAHCGGPVFVEEAEPVVVRPPIAPASRCGRPARAARRAS